ncbi:hypothetical protein [Streptomyces synnematoformans]|uniref:Band 7 domain-containing protein n=1 Tax=Streptomyces synnematoformans TaxID=415721 RepID=A0ABP5KSH5_9ACTN
MTSNYRPPAPNPDIQLPHPLLGPFIREFSPMKGYKHRGAQVASVLFYKNGGHSIVTVRGAHHVDKPLVGKPTSVCLIARGRHQVSFRVELPSYQDQAEFVAEADVNWEVQDFYLAAEKRVVDVARMLRPELLARLRGISRQYGLDRAQAADEAIQTELANGRWNDFGAGLGLVTQVYVRIDLGAAAQKYFGALVDVSHTSEVTMARDKAEQKRTQANIEHARQLISAGESEQYAFLMAQDPSRAVGVLQQIQQLAKEQRTGALDYLGRLIDAGVVQRHQVEDQVQRLIDFGRSVAGGVLGESGLPEPPTSLPLPPPAPEAPEPHDGPAEPADAGVEDGARVIPADVPPMPAAPPPPPGVRDDTR